MQRLMVVVILDLEFLILEFLLFLVCRSLFALDFMVHSGMSGLLCSVLVGTGSGDGGGESLEVLIGLLLLSRSGAGAGVVQVAKNIRDLPLDVIRGLLFLVH